MKICYIILAHSDLHLIAEQIRMLDAPGVSFFIHVDAKSSENIPTNLGNVNIIITEKRYDITWGDISMVEAVMNCSKEALLKFPDSYYFILLSGNCFPLKTGIYIRDYIESHGKFNFITGSKIPSLDCSWLEGGRRRLACYAIRIGPRDIATIEPRKIDIGNLRQFGKILLRGSFNALLQSLKVLISESKRCFPSGIEAYGGEFWWRLNRKSLEIITDYWYSHDSFQKEMEKTSNPDEIAFVSLVHSLCSNITNSILTFINWGGAKIA